MFKAAFIFAIIAAILAVFGFGGGADAAWGIAKILFFVALAITVILAILGFTVAKKVV
jgi:uncharacterized membrane protein YtjA (UPF0391 family)